ncbi:hypothetical protein ABPG72_003511 [Tetrahymena utriculariae]
MSQQEFQQFKKIYFSKKNEEIKIVDKMQKYENFRGKIQESKQGEFNEIKLMYFQNLRENNNNLKVINQREMKIYEYKFLEQKQRQLDQIELLLSEKLNDYQANSKNYQNINKN